MMGLSTVSISGMDAQTAMQYNQGQLVHQTCLLPSVGSQTPGGPLMFCDDLGYTRTLAALSDKAADSHMAGGRYPAAW